MIQNLQAKNLNGRTFGYELAPLVIITGNNTAGKSTIKDAITLATLGSVPGYPATNAGIMDNFATGPNLAVSIKTALGSFTRSWQRTGKTVKSDTMGDEAIAKALTPALFSGEQFIAAKPALRANMLRAAFPTLSDPKESVREAVTKAGGPLDSTGIKDLPFDEWVESYLEELAEEAKGYRATIKRMKGTIQGLTQLEAEEPAATVTKEELAAAREAVTAYAQKLGAAEQAVRSIVVPVPVTAPARTVEIIKAELAKLEEQRAALDAEIRTGSESYKNAFAAFNAAARVYDAAMERHSLAVSELDAAVKSGEAVGVDKGNFQAVIERTQESADRLEELERKAKLTKELHAATMTKADVAEAELAGLTAGVGDGCTCATCGAAKDHWKAEYLKLASEKIEAATRKHDAALEARQIAQGTASKASEELEKATAALEERDAALAIQEASLTLGEHPRPEGSIPEAPAAFDAENLQARLYEIESEISDCKDDLAAWETHADYEAKKAAKDAAETALAAVQAEHAAAQGRAARFQAAYDAGIAAAETAAKQAQAEKELADAEKALDLNEATATLVKAQAAKESEKVLAPMLAVANTFTAGILSPPMSNVGLDIGRWHGTQWQPIARLSGAEKAMVVAALSAALSQAGNKLVIIDEFSVIDDNWKPRFLANLKTAKEKGLIEQAIILDNRLVKSEGWENIELKA